MNAWKLSSELSLKATRGDIPSTGLRWLKRIGCFKITVALTLGFFESNRETDRKARRSPQVKSGINRKLRGILHSDDMRDCNCNLLMYSSSSSPATITLWNWCIDWLIECCSVLPAVDDWLDGLIPFPHRENWRRAEPTSKYTGWPLTRHFANPFSLSFILYFAGWCAVILLQ